MLKNQLADVDLKAEKQRLANKLESELQQYLVEDDTVYQFNYPVLTAPQKIKSINLSKTNSTEDSWAPVVLGTLTGIKGQYLIFEDGQVMNVRSHEGFVVELAVL